MKVFIALSCLVVLAAAKPGGILTPLAYSNLVPYSSIYAPTLAYSTPAIVGIDKAQYHSQDELGQAAYGHSEALQMHNAIQDAAGNKVGSYSYIAPNGQLIHANYVADSLGYRVASNALPAATPLAAPLDTPEVAAARIAHLAEFEKVKSDHNRMRRDVALVTPYYQPHPIVYSGYHTGAIAAIGRHATLTQVVNTPGHAVSYRVD